MAGARRGCRVMHSSRLGELWLPLSLFRCIIVSGTVDVSTIQPRGQSASQIADLENGDRRGAELLNRPRRHAFSGSHGIRKLLASADRR